MENKKGKLKISRNIFKNMFDNLGVIFSMFYPTYIEDNGMYPYVVYYGYSPLFDDVKDGEAIPDYDAILVMDNKDIVTLKEFKRLT